MYIALFIGRKVSENIEISANCSRVIELLNTLKKYSTEIPPVEIQQVCNVNNCVEELIFILMCFGHDTTLIIGSDKSVFVLSMTWRVYGF